MILWRQIRAAAREFLRERYREGRVRAVVVSLLVLSSAAVWTAILHVRTQEGYRLRAESADRTAWLAQGPKNPHTVAHFARFALLPTPSTAVLDSGSSAYRGSAVWLEAHWQRPANFREAEDRVYLGPFSDLTFAWVWQVIGPLCAILLGFDAVAGERARGTWALLAGNGGNLRALMIGKALGLTLLLVGTLLAALLLPIAGEAWMAKGPLGDLFWRNAGWVILHAAYLAAMAGFIVGISSWARSPQTALAALVMSWCGGTLVLPPVAANVAAAIAPVPSASEFWLQVAHDIHDGLDGTESASARARMLEEQTLARYGVASVSKLPVSYAAIELQAEEEYGNRVFDRRFGDLQRATRRQSRWLLALGAASPVTLVQTLSAALAATDDARHLDFINQAEAYRRALISRLNADMIEHGGGKDFQYRAPADFWASFADFRYHAPDLRLTAEEAGSGLAMLTWLGLVGYGLVRAPRLAHRNP